MILPHGDFCAANFIYALVHQIPGPVRERCLRFGKEKMKKQSDSTKKLVEASIMIALATVLSMLKVVDMPYGGSVTAASMLPIMIVSYRHGVCTGLLSGGVFAMIQQLLGLNTLSYVTTWQSVIAVILLDYIVAYTLVGLSGLSKGRIMRSKPQARRQSVELTVGCVFVCVLRYVCHVVAGATVWAGLSIPTEAAMIYSLGYNATYMLPETIVTTLAAAWIGGVLDLGKRIPERLVRTNRAVNERSEWFEILPSLAALISVFVVALDTILVAPHLQNAESGAFDFSGLSSAPWIAIAAVSGIGVVLVASLFAARGIKAKKDEE